MSSPVRRRIALLLTAALVGVAVWVSADVQRDAAARGGARMEASQRLLTSMLDQETGLRGYLLTGDGVFLEPLHSGDRAFDVAERDIRAAAGDDEDVLAPLDATVDVASRWHGAAREAIEVTRVDGPRRIDLAAALSRKELMDRFRAQVAELQDALVDARDRDQRIAAAVSAAISLLLFLAVGGAGLLWWRRAEQAKAAIAERERRYRDSQAEFAQAMQVVSSEDEANALIKRHLERSLPGSTVTVLNRNNSANRLEARTLGVPEGLAGRLADAEPRSCVALRLARPHAEAGDDDQLLACKLCGPEGGDRICSPLVVSGEVIGSVLAARDEAFDDQARQRIEDSVTAAAPVLANLRAVAIAEARAATDALTGLPNRRAVNDTLKRMVAQANRGVAPLTAIAVDLDRFKQINDRYGHDKGDEVLAAAAAALQGGIRASDFAGRMGGEEFIVLAPDTDLAGGRVLAEHLREAVGKIVVDGVDREITASFGVAALPDVATTPELLLRASDRALYRAKELGRDRVEVAVPAAPGALATAP
ncbi:MAG TPA: diguanylate cyclase [Capillimicrobium sp.]|nr:diguanylate cyclase [Capillimicrobium sp.]